MKHRWYSATLLGAAATSAVLAAGQADAAETHESILIRFTLPEGFVRLKPGGVTWAAANDPGAQRCVVTMTEVEFDSNPVHSFERGWQRMNFTRHNRLPPPSPVIKRLQGGYSIGFGSWVGKLSDGQHYTFAAGNVSRAQAGNLLIAYGTDSDCPKRFAALLQTVVVVDAEVPGATGGVSPLGAPSMAEFYRDANRAEQQLANQRMRDQQAQDRVLQQREQARQAQDRLRQQQDQARQAQQRIQESHRR